MGYYMRFFDTSEEPLTIRTLEAALLKNDPMYRLDVAESAASDSQADFYLGDALLGEIEINQAGDGLFEDEIQEMMEFLEDVKDKNRKRVESVLRTAKRTISVRVLDGDRGIEETLEQIDPLWKWLFAMRAGLLQADGEGYYDESELILEEGW